MSAEPIAFDASGYRLILERALARGYSILPLREAADAPPKSFLLRHDLDFSLDRAVAMAELEAELGIRSTYFAMVSSPFYNCFSPRGREALRRIAGLGHEVGLHWDSSTYPEDAEGASDQFQLEVRMLSSAVGQPVIGASQHIPTHNPGFDVSALIGYEAYSPRLVERFRYVSDSSMVWREATPLDLIESGIDIYFLAHPLWWMAEGKSQYAKFASVLGELGQALNADMAEQMDYLQFLIASRAEKDPAFRRKMGWSELPDGQARDV